LDLNYLQIAVKQTGSSSVNFNGVMLNDITLGTSSFTGDPASTGAVSSVTGEELTNGFNISGTLNLSSTNSCGDSDFLEIGVGYLQPVSVNRPPDCESAYPSIATLWPVNHKFQPIEILGVTDPDGDPVTITITGIKQDEPVNGTGDGNFEPDGYVEGSTAYVRAERDGARNGRVYTISFQASDDKGASCTGSVIVSVPKSMGKGGAAIDDGPMYDSTQ
jgi:hypothetical protein